MRLRYAQPNFLQQDSGLSTVKHTLDLASRVNRITSYFRQEVTLMNSWVGFAVHFVAVVCVHALG